MSKILTIDWDFFIDVPFEVRNNDFPRITDGRLNSVPDNSLWKGVDLKEVRLSYTEYYALFGSLYSLSLGTPCKAAYLSENHGEMLNAIEHIRNTLKDTSPLEIYNVDFHHDYYFSGNTPSCDNWLYLFKQKEPDTKMYWTKRPDSVITSFGEPVPIKDCPFGDIVKMLTNHEFDYIHFCRSDLYSPPIFDSEWYKMLWLIQSGSSKRFTLNPENIKFR